MATQNTKPWLVRVALLVSLICLATGAVGSYPGRAEANSQGQPGGNVADPIVRAVDIAKPAVVRIITSLAGHLTVKFSPTMSAVFPQGNNNPYLVQLSGSGTFISSHGDILTADHVVNPPHDKTLEQYLDTLAAPDIATYMNQNRLGTNVSADDVIQLLQSGQLASTPTYDQTQSEVYQSTDFTGPLSARTINDLDAASHATVDQIKKESSFNDKDVAVVHVAMNDMPSVQLGDSSTVQQQDELTIIGFPGNADISNRPTDLFTSSINKINVSSMKTTDTGAQVIQVGGNVEHGDSGGPALDSHGTVVGIVSFGLANGNSIGSTSFLQASNSAQDLVRFLKLDTKPGPLELAWQQAFTDYSSTTPGHWHQTQQEFQQLASKYPQFKALAPYLAYAKTQARSEVVPATRPKSNANATSTLQTIGTVLIVLAALLLLLLLGFFVLRSSQRKRKQAQVAATNLNPQVGQAARSGQPPTYMQSGGSQLPTMYPQQVYGGNTNHDMSAFGGPTAGSVAVPQPSPYQAGQNMPGMPKAPSPTTPPSELHPWPCGHMNRPNARFCTICGEPAAQEPKIRHYEQ